MIKNLLVGLGVALILGFAVYASNGGVGGGGISGGDSPFADSVWIDDGGGYYSGDNVESALQEVGAGTTPSGVWLAIDGSNANTEIDIGSENLITTGNIESSTGQFLADVSAGVAAPAYAFRTATDTGLYYGGAGELRFSGGGVLQLGLSVAIADFQDNDITTTGDISGDNATFESTTFPVVDIIRDVAGAGVWGGANLERTIPGASGSSGQGIGFYFKTEDDAGNSDFCGLFGGVLSTATSGSEIGRLIFNASWQDDDPYDQTQMTLTATSDSTADLALAGNLTTSGNIITTSGEIKVDVDGSSSGNYLSVGAGDELRFYHDGSADSWIWGANPLMDINIGILDAPPHAAGADINITAPDGNATGNEVGGDIVLTPGSGGGSGADGAVTVAGDLTITTGDVAIGTGQFLGDFALGVAAPCFSAEYLADTGLYFGGVNQVDIGVNGVQELSLTTTELVLPSNSLRLATSGRLSHSGSTVLLDAYGAGQTLQLRGFTIDIVGRDAAGAPGDIAITAGSGLGFMDYSEGGLNTITAGDGGSGSAMTGGGDGGYNSLIGGKGGKAGSVQGVGGAGGDVILTPGAGGDADGGAAGPAGYVKFGTRTANADAAITGYITIKDAAGNLRKLAIID